MRRYLIFKFLSNIIENMFYYPKRMKLNNKILEIRKLKCISYFNFFFVIKDRFTSDIFSKNVSLLQKSKNKIPSCTFQIITISSVFDEIKFIEIKIPRLLMQKFIYFSSSKIIKKIISEKCYLRHS